MPNNVITRNLVQILVGAAFVVAVIWICFNTPWQPKTAAHFDDGYLPVPASTVPTIGEKNGDQINQSKSH